MLQMFPVLDLCPTICASKGTRHAQMELATLRQENALVREKCEPSGKTAVLHDVCIVSRPNRNSITFCPNASKATQILLLSNSRQLFSPNG